MISVSGKTPYRTAVIALLLRLAPIPAVAQTDPTLSSYAMLDRKTASRLLLSQVKPEYPAVAKVNFIQGQVELQIAVSPDGRVGQVHVVRGHPFLAASALKAIRRWVYSPFMNGSVATGFQTLVNVNFSLHFRKLDEFPLQAERDLKGRIRPPEVLARPSTGATTNSVRMRILVSDSGRAIDCVPVAGVARNYEPARRDIERWTFRPARWGALSVPWYLDVDVPVESEPGERSTVPPRGQ